MAEVSLTVRTQGWTEATKAVGETAESLEHLKRAGGEATRQTDTLASRAQALRSELRQSTQTIALLSIAVGQTAQSAADLVGRNTALGQTFLQLSTAITGAATAIATLRLGIAALGGSTGTISALLVAAGAAALKLSGALDAIIAKIKELTGVAQQEREARLLAAAAEQVRLRQLELQLAERQREVGRATDADVQRARANLIRALETQRTLTRHLTSDTTKLLEIELAIANAQEVKRGRLQTVQQVLAQTVAIVELQARITNAELSTLARQLQAVHDRFARLPKAAQELRIELLQLRARIAELLREDAERQKQVRQQAIREEQDAIRQNYERIRQANEDARAEVAALDEQLRQLAEERADELRQEQESIRALFELRRQQVEDERADREALDEQLRRMRAEEIAALEAQLELARRRFELDQSRGEELRTARARLLDYLRSLLDVTSGVERLQLQLRILGLEADEAAQTMAERMRAASQDIREALRVVIDEVQRAAVDWVQAWRQAADDIRRGFSDGLFRVMRGELAGLVDMFDAVLAAIQRQLANFLASQITQSFVNFLGNLFGLGAPMLSSGQVAARQHGGQLVVTRPTLMLAGEAGAERVTVEPLAAPPTRREQPTMPAPPPQPLVVHIQAVDAESFVRLLSRHDRALADIVLGAVRRNTPVGKVLGGALP
jgi:hypothetical protein